MPLYLYPADKTDLFDEPVVERRPNLAPAFIAAFSAKLGVTFSPEDFFHYAYAVFHSPTYRSRYAEFLKIDFPRLPLTSDVALFHTLCGLGERLVGLHLMETATPTISRYPMAGDNKVETVRYDEGRVWINATQYFDNVAPEVWNFHVGGYQVPMKWLKDRKGRQLSYDDLTHYQQVIAVLAETLELQARIDAAIGEWPIQ